MKTKVVKIEREFEVGDVFEDSFGDVAVVKGFTSTLNHRYLEFHRADGLNLTEDYVNEMLDKNEMKYLGKVVKFGQHPEVEV